MQKLVTALVVSLLGLSSAFAQNADDAVRFKIQAGGRDLYKIAIPAPVGDRTSGLIAQEILSSDLTLSSFFKVLDQKAFLANLAAEGLGIKPEDWRNVGAEGVCKARATITGTEVKYEFRLFEVGKGDQPVLSKDYRSSTADARKAVHAWAAEVVKYFTGEDSFFNTRLAFAAKTGPGRKDIFVMDWDGAHPGAVTNASQNILPTWSPTGAELLYTSFMNGKPDLWTIPSTGGRPRPLSTRPGLNMGGVLSPDGTKIAITLSQDGNSEIYLLTSTGAVMKRLTNNNFIDTSPSWSPDGSKIAFVSDRHGTPQVWVMNADGSNQQKLTRRGTYNQTPRWCPKKDMPLIAFTARDERYAYDIFTVNVETGEVARVTEGHGSNQNPWWAPNGRALAYESTRGGIWISTADGRTERQIYRGDASGVAWSPAAK